MALVLTSHLNHFNMTLTQSSTISIAKHEGNLTFTTNQPEFTSLHYLNEIKSSLISKHILQNISYHIRISNVYNGTLQILIRNIQTLNWIVLTNHLISTLI